ncbi:zinc protease [Methylorubrum rhodinum]|uniref:Zinc protease n=1 Tax=Methylorubrum rhodinum TaxID=29428 RepID=A0A840ZGS5_9HYPH|nr:pitrilysin family protein [Methylorubrum rhodinum]MBB5756490.1 zinc protease [Methylorubrum rhodinum]
MTIHVGSVAASPSLAARVQVVRSPGGIEAFLLEDHALPLVSMQFGFHGGAALDPDGKAGTARMTGGLLCEGAGPFDDHAFQLALADRAIQLSFGIERDRLTGSLLTLSSELYHACELLGTALREPRFAVPDLERRRGAYAAELRHGLTQPGAVANTAFWERGFRGHAYGRPPAGAPEDLAAIGREDVVALHAALVTCAGLRIAVVGAVGADALAAALDAAFAGLPAGSARTMPATALAGVGERVARSVDAPQSSVVFGRPALPMADPDFPAAMVVNHCLGGNPFSSRLYAELREKRGLCYAIWTGFDLSEGVASLVGSTSTPNRHVDTSIALIGDEIGRLLQDGLGEDEIDAARHYLVGSHAVRLDTSTAIARQLLAMRFNGQPLSWLDERGLRIAAVTRAEVARAIARLFGEGDLLVASAGGLH